MLPGVPALIKLPPGSEGSASLGTLVDELLRSPCADRQLRLLSVQQQGIVTELGELAGWKRGAVDLGLRIFAGVDLDGWVRQRLISLRQLRAGPAAQSFRRHRLAVRLVEFLSRVSGGYLDKGYVAVAKLVSQPVYLADKEAAEVCDKVLEPLDGGLATTAYEHYALRRVERLQRRGLRRNMSEMEAIGVSIHQTPELRLFWGGPGSYSYPLHRDVSDGDVICTMYSGCKDLVILKPSARHFLDRIQVPGFQYMRQFTWSHDFFTDPPRAGVEGWSGTVRTGELLYLPGEMLHHIRNRCPQSASLCRRPWRASEVRDNMEESLKTLNLIREEESLEEGLESLEERVNRADPADFDESEDTAEQPDMEEHAYSGGPD